MNETPLVWRKLQFTNNNTVMVDENAGDAEKMGSWNRYTDSTLIVLKLQGALSVKADCLLNIKSPRSIIEASQLTGCILPIHRPLSVLLHWIQTKLS